MKWNNRYAAFACRREPRENQYYAFTMVAELGNLTKAAERLGYTQSGISHLLQGLEQELGFAVLVRTKSGMALTTEGERLLPLVKQLLAADENLTHMVREIQGLQVGTLRIGTFFSVAISWLPEILQDFSCRYPNIQVAVVNGTYADIETALWENRIECGFLTLPTKKTFTAIPLQKDRLMALVNLHNPLSQREALRPEDLRHEPYIVPAEGSSYDAGRLWSQAGIAPNVHIRMGDDFAAVAMVQKGLGITILPELLLRDMPMHEICAIPLEQTERMIGIAVNGGRTQLPVARRFIKLVQGKYAQEP